MLITEYIQKRSLMQLRKGRDDLYTNECAPTTSNDIAIHSKKLDELKYWLQRHVLNREKNEHPRCLLLTGPTGSGKSTALQVLCGENSINYVDFEPELEINDDSSPDNTGLRELYRFLTQSGISFGSKKVKSLLVITSLPNSAYNNIMDFREIFIESLSIAKIPICFCLSDVESCWALNHRRLFTSTFIQDNNIDSLKFNPVAVTLIKKAVERASSILHLKLTASRIKTIADSSNNDLRIAMNMTQMNYSVKSYKKDTNLINSGRANREDTFHMLGRILYAHRIDQSDSQTTARKKRTKTKQVISSKPTERTPLEHDVNDIIQMSSMPSCKILDFLHEHEPKFSASISDLRCVLDAFSLCDVINSNWDVQRRTQSDDTAQISARAVMWHNFNGQRPGWLPLKGPIMTDLIREIGNSKDELSRLPQIGNTEFITLTSHYNSIISPDLNPNNIASYLTRPMHMSWKAGRDNLSRQMNSMNRSVPFKTKFTNQAKRRKSDPQEEEEEKIIIEESDDDSFDDF